MVTVSCLCFAATVYLDSALLKISNTHALSLSLPEKYASPENTKPYPNIEYSKQYSIDVIIGEFY